MRRLQEPFRTVVILRDLEGLPYDEIAEILGTHLGTVKSRLVRGRAMLRARLQPLIAQAHPDKGILSGRPAVSSTSTSEASGSTQSAEGRLFGEAV